MIANSLVHHIYSGLSAIYAKWNRTEQKDNASTASPNSQDDEDVSALKRRIDTLERQLQDVVAIVNQLKADKDRPITS